MLAHIRNGALIATFPSGRGTVHCENGDKTTTPVAGYVNGNDRVVPLVKEEVGSGPVRSRETIVEADRVVIRTTLSEKSLEDLRAEAELDRFDFAMAVFAAGIVTSDVAAQWAAGNAMPAQVAAVIQTLPEAQRGPATIDVLARPKIRRNAGMMPALAAAFDLNEAALDLLFGIGV